MHTSRQAMVLILNINQHTKEQIMSLNEVTLIGRLGQNVEMRTMPDGTPTCNISIATSETWTDKATGQKKESTEWHRTVFYGRLAEVCGQYLVKGSQVWVRGKLQTRKWTDQQGIERYQTEIIVRELQMLGNPSNQTSGQNTQVTQQAKPSATSQQAPETMQQQAPLGEHFNDDVPF